MSSDHPLKSIMICAAAGAILLLSASAAAAQEAGLKACMIDEEPWGNAADPGMSIYAETFQKLGELLGQKVDFFTAPLARVLEAVKSGSCQFTITSWQPTRFDRVTAGAVFARLDYGILPRQGLELGSLADLKHLRIATARGLLIGEAFDKDGEIDKVEVYGYDQAVRMVEAKRADGAVGSIITLKRIARLHHVGKYFGTPLVLSQVPLALQMNKDFAKTEAARKVDGAVAQLRENGQAAEIIRRYFDVAAAETQ
jgi:ABC-type amino acid transport substrate-binding protein